VQIRKHKDYRVNKLAEFIEHLQDVKYHIKPFEMAENIVLFMDDLRGKEYAQKMLKHLNEERQYRGN
jgi:hypothetical protein